MPEYWIVDPASKTLEVYRLDGDRYHLPRELSGEARFEPEMFPGLTIELRDLWL